MTLKERKYISNFDIGKNSIISSGRLTTTDVNTGDFGATSAYTGYNQGAQAYRLSIMPLTLSTLAGTASTLSSIAGASSQVLPSGITNAARLGALAGAGNGIASGVSETALKEGGKTLADAVTSSGGTAASAGLSAVGYATGIAGTAYGVYNMISGALNYKNRIHDTDMLAGASTSTQSKFGRTYKQYGGFDESGILNMTDAQNSADNANMTMSGASTGLSAGATIGSVIPGLGTIAGGLIGGALGGIFGGLFGSSKARERRRKVELDIANTKEAIGGYNAQAESVAGSEGLRDMYNASRGSSTTGILRADKGKVPGYTDGKVSGYMSPDETGYDPTKPIMELTFYPGSPDPNVKDKRVDNLELHGNIDPLTIFGHEKKGDKYYADLARPFGKKAELIKEQYYNEQDPNIKAGLMQEMDFINKNMAALALMLLDDMERKEMKHTLNYKRINADRGKTPRYALGKLGLVFNQVFSKAGDYAVPTITGALLLGNLIDYGRYVHSQTPHMQPSAYTPVNSSKYMQMLTNNMPDAYRDLKDVDDSVRQNIYNVRQSGALSAGLRQALIGSYMNKANKTKSGIRADYNNRRYNIMKDAASMGSSIDLNNATRSQQDNLARFEQHNKAQGAQWNNIASLYHNKPTVYGSIAQNFDATGNRLGMMNLYNYKANTDRMAILNQANNTVGTLTTATPRFTFNPSLSSQLKPVYSL